jgi:hypothetical protein
MAKDWSDPKREELGSNVTVSLPALMKSASAVSAVG